MNGIQNDCVNGGGEMDWALNWVTLVPQQSATKRRAGLRLKAARMAVGYDQPRGKSQAAFYRMFATCGTKSRGNNWEKGVSYPNTDFLIELYQQFGVTPDWVLLEIPHGMPERIANKIVYNFRKILDETEI